MIYHVYLNKILSKILPNHLWKKYFYDHKYKEIKDTQLGIYLKKNKHLKNIHKGQRCFILGNGPSLTEVDLSLLKDEFTFTVNDLFYKEDFKELNTTYHLFADPYYFENLEEVIDRLKSKANPLGIFLESNGYQQMRKQDLNTKYPIYIYANGIEIDDLVFTELDLCQFLPYFCTVVQNAIAISAYMGFSEIYLLGCDCTGILNYIDRVKGQNMKHYAYLLPEEDQIRQQGIKISCEHMFFEWHHIFKSYRILREELHKKHIKIVNLTESGILDSLEKGRLEDVLQSK